jgi:hypothetical protein
MEKRIIFLMDKTFSRDDLKCSLYSNMDSSRYLFAGCNYEKEIKIEAGTLHNSTDFEHQYS